MEKGEHFTLGTFIWVDTYEDAPLAKAIKVKMDLSSRAISQKRAKEDCDLIKLMRTRKINT